MGLRFDDVTLGRGDFRLAADLEIPAEASVAVIGPSGGGKSTLLEAVAGFLEPLSGRILWEERDLAGLAPAARPVSLVFQENNLFAHLDIARNVGLGIAPSGRLARADRDRVDAVLERVGLAGLGGRLPRELSGGQRSRAALARVLLRSKPLILLDEPFSALGPALRADMLELVEEIRAEAGATLLMITHQPEDARRICGQTVVVAEGRVSPPVETAGLLADPPPALRAYLG